MKLSFAVKSIFVLISNLLSIKCNIIDMDHYKLSENTLRVNSRYVFSDFSLDKSKPLQDAEI